MMHAIDVLVGNLFRVRCRWNETVTTRSPYGDMTFIKANDALSGKTCLSRR